MGEGETLAIIVILVIPHIIWGNLSIRPNRIHPNPARGDAFENLYGHSSAGQTVFFAEQ